MNTKKRMKLPKVLNCELARERMDDILEKRRVRPFKKENRFNIDKN